MIYVLFVVLLIHDIMVTSQLKNMHIRILALKNLYDRAMERMIESQKRK